MGRDRDADFAIRRPDPHSPVNLGDEAEDALRTNHRRAPLRDVTAPKIQFNSSLPAVVGPPLGFNMTEANPLGAPINTEGKSSCLQGLSRLRARNLWPDSETLLIKRQGLFEAKALALQQWEKTRRRPFSPRRSIDTFATKTSRSD